MYELPFSEASFDVAYAQQVFQHLGEPSPMGEGAVEYGYASRSELEAMAAAAHPDALWAFVNVEALARKPA